MEIVVRKLTQADRSAWEDLYYGYLEFYESTPQTQATEILWSRLVSEQPLIQGYVAELDGELVGFAHCHFQLTSWSHTFHCYLEDLFVSPVSRSKGVATELINAVRKAALENQCSEMFWITKSNNQTARKLYDKLANLSDFVRYEILLED